MTALDGLRIDLAGAPLMIKIDHAAHLLGIGRTLAYRLAGRFQKGDPTGLPVVWIGGCLRVPRWALVEYVLHGRVDADLRTHVRELVDEMIGEASSGGEPDTSTADEQAPRALQLGFEF
jgi:hypothetical protein